MDVWKFSACPANDVPPEQMQHFVKSFLDSPDAVEFLNNPHGAPGVLVVNSSMPHRGLGALGFEGIEALETFFADKMKAKAKSKSDASSKWQQSKDTIDDILDDLNKAIPDKHDGGAEAFKNGDVLIFQARPRGQLYGGSTALGRLRRAMWKEALKQNLVVNKEASELLWVTDFPLFTPASGSADEVQCGDAAIVATHHPFTAPKSAKDVDLLLTDPLKAKADHYDLVMNGVEVGGGSRRIHDADMQAFIMKDILKVRRAVLTTTHASWSANGHAHC